MAGTSAAVDQNNETQGGASEATSPHVFDLESILCRSCNYRLDCSEMEPDASANTPILVHCPLYRHSTMAGAFLLA